MSAQTIGQIVRQIIEQLSDGVSQLVLMVVVLQEQNADVPPSLPPAANAVTQTAVTLAKVAQSLAQTNYKEFPNIAKDIIDAAVAVNGANDTMNNAVRILTTNSDRKTGWTGLVDACRVMSGKTIKLLQIVYGAELKRLYAVADNILDEIAKVNTADAKNSPQAFADQAGELASRAAQLAQFLNQRAKDEENPFLRRELEEKAALLDSKANDLISAANDLLEDPDNVERIKRVNDLLKDLNDLVSGATRSVKDSQPEIHGHEEGLPTLANAAAAREAERARRAAEEEEAAYNAIPADFKLFEPVQPPLKASVLQKQVQALRSAVDQIADAAAKGDAAGAHSAAKNAHEKTLELQKAANDHALKSHDPHYKALIAQTLKDIDELLGKEISAAKNALENPTAENKQKVGDTAEEVHKTLDELLHETRPAAIAEQVHRAGDLVEKLKDAVKRGDDKTIADLLRQLNDLERDLEHQAKFQAQNADDIKKAQQIVATLNDLKKAVGDLENAAKRKDQAKTNSDGDKVKAALQELLNATNGTPIASAHNIYNDLEKMQNAIDRKDLDALRRAAKLLGHDTKNLLARAREAAERSKDPEERKRILDSIARMEASLRDQLAALQRFTDNPNDPAAKEALTNLTKGVHDATKELEDALAGKKSTATGGDVHDPAAVAKYIGDLEKELRRLQELQEILRRNPNDKAAQEELKALMDKLDSSANGLLAGVTNDIADNIRARVAELKTHADDLYDSINKGDVKQAAKASQQVANSAKLLSDLLRKEAAKATDPAVKQDLENAAKGIEKHAADTLAAAKAALENPNDSAAKTKLKTEVENLKQAADQASDFVFDDLYDEKTIRDTTKALEEGMQQLQTNARKGDRKAVEEGLQKLDNNAKRFLKAANKRHVHNPDPQDPMAELRRLWNTIGHPARELAREPKGPNAPKNDSDLADIIQKARSAMNKVNGHHHVSPVAAVQDVDHALNRLKEAMHLADPAAVSAEAKNLVAKANALVPIAQAEKNAQKQNQLADAVNDLNAQIKKTLADASASLQDPTNSQKKAKVDSDIDSAKVPVAKLQELLSSPADDRKLQREIAEAKAHASGLNDAAAANDKAKIEEERKALKESLGKVLADTKAAIAKETDPGKKELLLADLAKIEEGMKKLDNPNLTSDQLRQIALDLGGALDDLLRNLNNDKVDSLDKAKGKAAALAAKIRGANGELDLNSLLGTANDLSKWLRSMIADANALARSQNKSGLSEAASSALKLDDLLSRIEKSNSPQDIADLGKLVDSLTKLKASTAAPPPPKAEPKTFEEALDQAAAVIKQAVASAKTDNQSSSGVAAELEKLAAAARTGQRQAMLIASRAVAAHLQTVINEINQTLKNMGNKNPKEQDRLFRAAQALRNFGTQLKILTSVKAASIEKDADADESLLSITKGLGNVLADAISTMDTVKITVLKIR